MIQSRAVHIDGCPERQSERRDFLLDAEVLFAALQGNGQSRGGGRGGKGDEHGGGNAFKHLNEADSAKELGDATVYDN